MTEIDETKICSDIISLIKAYGSRKTKKADRELLQKEISTQLNSMRDWIAHCKTEIEYYQEVFVRVGKIIKFLEG